MNISTKDYWTIVIAHFLMGAMIGFCAAVEIMR